VSFQRDCFYHGAGRLCKLVAKGGNLTVVDLPAASLLERKEKVIYRTVVQASVHFCLGKPPEIHHPDGGGSKE